MIRNGIFPTMITPYRSGSIDFAAVDRLVAWYQAQGCTGIFAVCQSSEMNFLSLAERVALATRVVKAANGQMNVVASGHCAASIEAQAEEINALCQTGIDAFVWVSNRLDPHDQGDDIWIANAEKLLALTDTGISLGIYECPWPYKRLLTPRILEWCKKTGRFTFIKDTCCDPVTLEQRLTQLKGSGIKLFNANAQTLYHSLLHGAAGYSGIMANFHPDLLVWLYENYTRLPVKAETASDFLSMAAFTEGPSYPLSAKYYLATYEGIDMEIDSRSSNPKNLTPYQKLVMAQLYRQSEKLRAYIKEN